MRSLIHTSRTLGAIEVPHLDFHFVQFCTENYGHFTFITNAFTSRHQPFLVKYGCIHHDENEQKGNLSFHRIIRPREYC